MAESNLESPGELIEVPPNHYRHSKWFALTGIFLFGFSYCALNESFDQYSFAESQLRSTGGVFLLLIALASLSCAFPFSMRKIPRQAWTNRARAIKTYMRFAYAFGLAFLVCFVNLHFFHWFA